MNERAVVITGTSTGIGRASALALDRMGFRVFAGVRKHADGEALERETSSRLTPVILDVTDAASIDAAAQAVGEATGGMLWGLVNNAGIGIRGPLECVPIADFRWQLEVNLVGQLAVTHAFVPSIREAQGRIVFVGSVGGRLASPFLGLYAASKSGLERIADALRMELGPWGIQVSTLICGCARTPIWEKGKALGSEIDLVIGERGLSRYAAALKRADRFYARIGSAGVAPERVAERVGHALTAKRARSQYFIGWDAVLYSATAKWLPARLRGLIVARWMGLGRP